MKISFLNEVLERCKQNISDETYIDNEANEVSKKCDELLEFIEKVEASGVDTFEISFDMKEPTMEEPTTLQEEMTRYRYKGVSWIISLSAFFVSKGLLGLIG